MATRINFTKASIDRLTLPKADKSSITYYDEKVSGLTVMAFPSGKKVFYLSKKIQGRSEKIKIGAYPDLSVENARNRASELLAEIAQGKNPQDKRRAFNKEMTFGELFDWYMKEYASKHKTERSQEEDRGLYRRYLEDWQNKKLSLLTKLDISRKHSQVGTDHGKVGANRMLNLVKAMFNKAIALEKWQGNNPAFGIVKFKETSRDRFLRPDEIRHFLDAAAKEGNTAARDYVLLSLLTGARKSNVLAMRWADINLTRGEWRIPLTKNQEPLTIPLAPEAIDILQQRLDEAQKAENSPKEAQKPSEWVFPSNSASGHLHDPRKAFNRILKEAGIKDLRIHDLRRTLGSWLAASGANQYIIGKTLGQKDSKATAVYARLDLDPVRQSVNTVVQAMMSGKAAGKKK